MSKENTGALAPNGNRIGGPCFVSTLPTRPVGCPNCEGCEGCSEMTGPAEAALTLSDGIVKEKARVRAIKAEYEALPGGAGRISAVMMEADLRETDAAVASGSITRMVIAYNALKGYEL